MDTFVFLLLFYKTASIGRGVRLLNVIMRNGRLPYRIRWAYGQRGSHGQAPGITRAIWPPSAAHAKPTYEY